MKRRYLDVLHYPKRILLLVTFWLQKVRGKFLFWGKEDIAQYVAVSKLVCFLYWGIKPLLYPKPGRDRFVTSLSPICHCYWNRLALEKPTGISSCKWKQKLLALRLWLLSKCAKTKDIILFIIFLFYLSEKWKYATWQKYPNCTAAFYDRHQNLISIEIWNQMNLYVL